MSDVLGGTLRVELPDLTAKPAPKPAPVKSRPASQLAARLHAAIERYGLTQEELAELLSGFTGIHIARTALAGWLRDTEPRIELSILMSALDKIDAAEGQDLQPKYISGADIKRQIASWLKTMSRRQIMLAGELPQSTYQQYEAGLVSVPRRRWDRIHSLITMWRTVARQAGALKSAK